jgi:branched-chain amino acid transport system ATP-binding protein
MWNTTAAGRPELRAAITPGGEPVSAALAVGRDPVRAATSAVAASAGETILSVNNIEVVYNSLILVLKGVSLTVPKAGIVALLGANGAGKTTTLKAISNLLRAERGEVTKGSIMFQGVRVDTQAPDELVRRGCIQVLEGRACFGHLTIEENLLTGAFTRRDGAPAVRRDLAMIYDSFPRLKERRRALAGYTSGGEQQMCAVGRAMMSRPSMVLLDEPSLGLAPQVVREIFDIVRTLNQTQGVSFLLAEQNANLALAYATHGYVLETGRVVMDGSAASLRENDDVQEFYLGVTGRGRKSFRDAKSYKRRKRWLS